MTDDDDLDRMWRDGLTTAADGHGTTSGVRKRVAARVRHRRHRRRAASAGAIAALSATAVVGVAELRSGSSRLQVTTPDTTAPPVLAPVVRAVVQVNDAPGGALKIEFPGHDLGDPPSIRLPSGLIRFEIHELSGGHDLRIDNIPGFDVEATTTPITVTRDVQLDPGVYVMYCAIPGHREAGESVTIDVR
jgi:hypothetical protein